MLPLDSIIAMMIYIIFTDEEMSTSEVFKHFYVKLVRMLPMNDAIFMAKLFSAKLLPGDVKYQVESMSTQADKATHFLDRVIQPSVTSGVGRHFYDLIKVMEDSEYNGVKELAKLIRNELRERAVNSETG